MANWVDPSKGSWNNPPYQPVYEPGPTPQYAEQYGGPSYGHPPPQSYAPDSKSAYDGGRFTPKKTVNDIFFLLFFIAQVCITSHHSSHS